MPILMTQGEWDRIVKWTDEDKEDPDAARLRSYIAYLNTKSAEMTKTWPNSLENVNKRNEEMRRARIESHENTNARFYKRYVKRKKEEQERMMHSARDTIFKNKDAPKLLLSAVVESVILKEREVQIKFSNEFVGGYQREQNRLYDESVKQKAKEWNELQEEKKRRRFMANKQHQKDLLDQIHEIETRKGKEMEEELDQQRQDIANSNKELAAIKKFEQEFKEAEKQRIWRDNTHSIREKQQRLSEQAARDGLDDRLIGVLTALQCRVEGKRRATEKETRDKKLRVLEAISKKLETSSGARDAKEQASLDKAVQERTAAVEARHKKQMEKNERFRQEKIQSRKDFLQKEAQELHEKQTMQNWALMNRFKNQEIYEEYKENLRKEKERKTKQYREDILKQRKEVEDRNAKELADTRHFYGALAEQKLREADNKLLTHALELLGEARAHGRPTLPIEKAIDRYCKIYRLYPMPPLPRTLQSHFPRYSPRDGSAPDPAYRPPPAPAPRPAPDHELDGPTNGLQGTDEPVKAAVAKPAPAPAPKPASDAPPAVDYKRKGPANGLQCRPEPPQEIVLPPITVVTYPCKKIGMVSNVPLKKEACECAVVGEI